MALFSVIALVITLLGLTNLINWMWRGDWLLNDNLSVNKAASLGIIATILYLVACYWIVRCIIIWGQPLIK